MFLLTLQFNVRLNWDLIMFLLIIFLKFNSKRIKIMLIFLKQTMLITNLIIFLFKRLEFFSKIYNSIVNYI